MSIQLKQMNVPAKVFDDILDKFSERVSYVDDFDRYRCGYPDKKKIVWGGQESRGDYLICQVYIFAYVSQIQDYDDSWKQVILRRCENLSEPEDDINGARAYQRVLKIVDKYYNEEEKERQFKLFSANYSERNKQLHYIYTEEVRKIVKLDNCYKFDINGAHASALMEIFPKASDEFLKMYQERKIKPINKSILNYSIGYFCKTGHRKTYNWIVQRTTSILETAIDNSDGTLIYANTDGFIIQNPKNVIEASSDIGKFKLEYFGEVYTYRDINYSIIQCGDSITGNVLNSVRAKIDLRKGKVVHYRKARKDNLAGPAFFADNITEEIL